MSLHGLFRSKREDHIQKHRQTVSNVLVLEESKRPPKTDTRLLRSNDLLLASAGTRRDEGDLQTTNKKSFTEAPDGA